MAKNSKRYELNKVDILKILKGLGIAVGGAALTFIAEVIPGINFGDWTPVAVAVSSALVNMGRKLLEGKK